MELTVIVPSDKTKSQTMQVSDKVFARDFNEALVHQVVTAYLAGARAGTKAQKTRAEVSGGGKKPWRQKGTGRARAGTNRSPLWRGGGITFAAKMRDHSQKVNKKMYQNAIAAMLSELIRKEHLKVVESLQISGPKTKELVAKLKELGLENVLIITDNVEKNLFLASRNIPHVEIIDVAAIDPVSLIRFENVMMTEAAVKQVEEWLG